MSQYDTENISINYYDNMAYESIWVWHWKQSTGGNDAEENMLLIITLWSN